MFFADRFKLSPSSPPVSNATYLRIFFLEFIYFFRKILLTIIFFCCSIYIETAQNSREQCNELADLLFWRLSLCLSSDSLSCDTRETPVSNATNLRTFYFEDYHYTFQAALCPVTLAHQIFVFYSNWYFYTSDTFRPILALFTHFILTKFFLSINYHAKYFSYPWWRCCSEFNYYF